MRNFKKITSIIILFLAINTIAGCATSIVYDVGGQAVESQPSFKLVDARDENQKEAKISSLLITDCLYGLYQIGDDQTTPHRINLLEQHLNASLGDRLKGQMLTVNRYTIFNNYRSNLVGSQPPDTVTLLMAHNLNLKSLTAWTVAPLAVGVIQANMCEDPVFREKNINNLPSVIVNVDVTVAENRITGNVVQIEPVGKEATSRGEFTRERMKAALSAANQKIAEEIGKLLGR